MCNPLGSHAGVHKLGVLTLIKVTLRFYLTEYLALYYYTLGNLRPELRSTHRSIQLIACVETPDLKKYGHDVILEPFIRDVKKLYEVNQYIQPPTSQKIIIIGWNYRE